MASSEWHAMNNIVSDISKTSRQIEDAKVHVMLNKNSIMKYQVSSLELKRDALYENLCSHMDSWIEKVMKRGNGL